MKRMLNKINYFELFTKDKVVCFLLLIHIISKRLDNKFNKFNYSQLSMNHSEKFWEICIYMPVYRLQFDFCA